MPISVTAYIDDSKDAAQQQFVIAAAVVGLKAEWSAFHKRWSKVLKSIPPISHFHALEWRGLRGEFKQFREDGCITDTARALADRKRDALLDVILTSRLVPVSVTVDVQDWKRATADHPRPEVIQDDAYRIALQELMFQIAKDATPKAHRVKFICDDDNRAAVYQQVYADFRRKNHTTAKKIGTTLDFADDEVTFGIQAADLIAHELNKVHREHGLAIRDQPLPPNLSRLQPHMYVCDYKHLMALLDAQSY